MFVERLEAAAAAWFARRHPPSAGEVIVDHRKVYILPTRAGFLLAAGVVLLLIGSINYALQLGYLLTFFVASVAVVGMYYTQRNLTGLAIASHGVRAVFAGESAAFQLTVRNTTPVARPALGLHCIAPRRRRRTLWRREERLATTWCDVPASGSAVVAVALPTRRRGRHACPPIRIGTRFPFGLFGAWTIYRSDLSAIVYPAPEADPPPMPPGDGDSAPDGAIATSGEDLAGVRPYRVGDPRKAIAWRLAARSDELLVKFFDVPSGGRVLLDFDALPRHLDTEQRLSRLTRWLLAADEARLDYGLALPGRRIAPGHGPEQRTRCLEALALYAG
ncbi:MAG TPA: DUF58 domain-containing protein [Burkholderiaceae bacterium]|nr:DUF58 domain-containing protein [Burkholderiaceae bacterium]